MIINSENALLKTSVAGAGLAPSTATHSTGSWMAELEKAFIAEQPPQDMSGQSALSYASNNSANGNEQSNDAFPGNQPESETSPQAGSGDRVEAGDSSITPQGQSSGNAIAQNGNSSGATGLPASATAANRQASNAEPTEKSTSVKAPAALRTTTAKAKDISQAGLSPLAPTMAVAFVDPTAALQQVKQYQAMTSALASTQAEIVVPTIDKVLPNVQLPLQASDASAAQPNMSTALDDNPLGQLSESAPETSAPSQSDPYPLKQMHLLQSEGGVQAWIRDAGLSQPQAYFVAQALSSELHQSGLKLNALMLNGKKIAGLFQGNQYSELETMSVDQQQRIDDAVHSFVAANPGVDEKGAK